MNIFKNIEGENNEIEDNMIGSVNRIRDDKNIKTQSKGKQNIGFPMRWMKMKNKKFNVKP